MSCNKKSQKKIQVIFLLILLYLVPSITLHSQIYSQSVLVRIPRFVLKASYEPEGYKVVAECIDNEYKNNLSQLNGVLKFKWGVKFADKAIVWTETDKMEFNTQLHSNEKKAIVFLEVNDMLGNKTPIQQIEVNSEDIYVVSNTNLYIDSEGIIYKDSKKKYSHNTGRMYLDYRENLDKGREWMSITATVLSPFRNAEVITTEDDGPLIRDVLPKSELDFIKSNSEDGQKYAYSLILQNAKRKAIQIVPVTFTYKSKI